MQSVDLMIQPCALVKAYLIPVAHYCPLHVLMDMLSWDKIVHGVQDGSLCNVVKSDSDRNTEGCKTGHFEEGRQRRALVELVFKNNWILTWVSWDIFEFKIRYSLLNLPKSIGPLTEKPRSQGTKGQTIKNLLPPTKRALSSRFRLCGNTTDLLLSSFASHLNRREGRRESIQRTKNSYRLFSPHPPTFCCCLLQPTHTNTTTMIYDNVWRNECVLLYATAVAS